MTTNPLDNLFNGLIPQSTIAANVAAVAQHMHKVPLALPLKDFQEEAVDHCLREASIKPYAYLALEMGLGKTPCAIAIAAASVAAGQRPVLIGVPPALRMNWEREFKKFAPHLDVHTLRGARPDCVTLPDADVLIIGFSSLTPPTPTKQEKDMHVTPKGWTDMLVGNIAGFVVDEAHYLKNKSGRSLQFRRIADVTPGLRLLMSGTPTPNGRHAELGTQINLLGRRAWSDIGGEGTFWHYYAPKADAYGTRASEHAEELFNAMSSTWYYRRLRKDVIELPNKGRNVLAIEGKGRGVRSYLKAEANLIAWLQETGRDTRGAERAEALVRLTTMRMLAGECKIQEAAVLVNEMLTEEPGGVFVVAEHTNVIDGMLMKLAKWKPTIVAGGMSDRERQENIDDFVSGRSRVLIGQIQAAGTGHTLHGDGRNHREVVVQLPWTPAALLQVEDRLHRMGQTRDVEINICLAAIEGSLTIDERLWGMINQKAFNASAISDGKGEFLLEDAVDGLLDSYR